MSDHLIVSPLHRYPVFDTSDPDLVRDSVSATFGATRINIDDPSSFRAQAHHASLKNIELIYGGCTTGVAIDYPPSAYYRIMLPLQGSIEVGSGASAVALDEQGGIVMPEVPWRLAAAKTSGWLTLRVRTDALATRPRLDGSLPASSPLLFPAAVSLQERRMNTLRGLLAALISELNEIDIPNPIIVDGLQDLIVAAFCRLSPSFEAGHEARMDAHDSEARRVADYIDANWHRHVSLDELVAIANVSARTLLRTFQRLHGVPPMVFAKQRRLTRARDMLLEADESTTVTQVGFCCGFSNLGHFARDYRALFGESPSRTLARGKGRS